MFHKNVYRLFHSEGHFRLGALRLKIETERDFKALRFKKATTIYKIQGLVSNLFLCFTSDSVE